MDFLHCQHCGHWPHFQPENRQRYYISSCGNLYCETCLHSFNNKCPTCQVECRLMEVNAQSNVEIKSYFLDPLSMLRDVLKKPFQILQFQRNQQKDCLRLMTKVMDAHKGLQNENDALKAEILRLKQCGESYKQQVEQLQAKINELEQNRSVAFAFPTPVQPVRPGSAGVSQMGSGNRNDVLNLFREPPERPNPHVVHPITASQNVHRQSQFVAPSQVSNNPFSFTPAGCNPSRSTQQSPTCQMRSSALHGGSQNFIPPRQSPALFGTPAVNSQFILGQQSPSIRPADKPALFNFMTGQAGLVPSRTPELINRLRNLNCKVTPATGGSSQFRH